MKEIGAIFVVSISEIRTVQLAAIKRRYTIFQGNPLQNDIQFHPVHFHLSYFNSTIPRLQTNHNYSANQVLSVSTSAYALIHRLRR